MLLTGSPSTPFFFCSLPTTTSPAPISLAAFTVSLSMLPVTTRCPACPRRRACRVSIPASGQALCSSVAPSGWAQGWSRLQGLCCCRKVGADRKDCAVAAAGFHPYGDAGVIYYPVMEKASPFISRKYEVIPVSVEFVSYGIAEFALRICSCPRRTSLHCRI